MRVINQYADGKTIEAVKSNDMSVDAAYREAKEVKEEIEKRLKAAK